MVFNTHNIYPNIHDEDSTMHLPIVQKGKITLYILHWFYEIVIKNN